MGYNRSGARRKQKLRRTRTERLRLAKKAEAKPAGSATKK
jgi:hypothetical protein